MLTIFYICKSLGRFSIAFYWCFACKRHYVLKSKLQSITETQKKLCFNFSSSFWYLFFKTCNDLVVNLIRSARRWYYIISMMSGHGANPIFFHNKKIKIGNPEHLLTSHPLCPITSHFCLTPPPPAPSLSKWTSDVYLHPKVNSSYKDWYDN